MSAATGTTGWPSGLPGHGVHNTDHLASLPPAAFAMPSMGIYRAEGDQPAEHRAVRDEHSVLVQVGALPAPQLPAELARSWYGYK
jgi:hypothetical protein